MQTKIIIGLVAIALSFGAGYFVGDLKGDRNLAVEKLAVSQQNTKNLEEFAEHTQKTLKVITKHTEDAARLAQTQADSMSQVVATTNRKIEKAQKNAEAVNVQISKIDSACDFGPEYRRLLGEISQRANSGRRDLYPAED